MFFSCRICTVKHIVQSLCNSRASCLPRDAILSGIYAVVVCLSVCLTPVPYCINTAKRRIMQTIVCMILRDS